LSEPKTGKELVLKYGSAHHSKQNNQIIVCLSNTKAALSTNLLQLGDKMLEKKYCKMVYHATNNDYVI